MNLNPILDRLAANIFEHPYASDGKNSQGIFVPCRKMSKKSALTKAVIQFNGPRRLAYIIIDIDYDYAALAWQDNNCPPPNMIIINPTNGHAHYVYELKEPVWRKQKDDHRVLEAKPIWLYKAVTKALTSALHGDPGYNGLLGKNPFHPNWRVSCIRSEPYRLTELSMHLDLPVGGSIPDPVIRGNDEVSRVWDCILFDSVSRWARRAKSNYNNYKEFQSDIGNQLNKLNSTSDRPLKSHELKGMCRRISKWTWYVYEKSGVEWKKSLSLSPDEIRQRQSFSGKNTNKARKESSLNKIRVAIRTLRHNKSKISKAAISHLSGLSRRTIYSYTLFINSLLTQEETVFPTGTNHQAPSGQNIGIPDILPYCPLTTAYTYPEILRQQPSGRRGVITAIAYAYHQAKLGIIINELPIGLRNSILRTIEKHTMDSS